MKCPVCDKENRSMLCPQCGFDSCRDYVKYPTFGPVRNARPVSELREEWQEKQKAAETAESCESVLCETEVPVQKKRRVQPYLIAAAFAVTLGMGVWIGTGSGSSAPAGLEESVQMQEPPENVKQTVPPESEVQTAPPETTQPRRLAPVIDVAVSWNRVAALHADGTVSVVVENGRGLLQGDTQQWNDITDIDVGYHHTVGLRADGTVVAAGSNVAGQCNVSEWTDIVAITVGDEFTVGLKSDGTLVAAGNNENGQCDVGDLKDIVSIEASDYSLQCLDSSGRWIMIGDGSWHADNGKKLGIVKLGAGHYNSAGIREDGTARMISNNDFVSGKLDISSWDDLVDISVGGTHILGLRADGTVLAVGKNEHGECDVSEWTDIVAISAGNDHSVGVRADGTLVAAGIYPNSETKCDVSELNEWIGP